MNTKERLRAKAEEWAQELAQLQTREERQKFIDAKTNEIIQNARPGTAPLLEAIKRSTEAYEKAMKNLLDEIDLKNYKDQFQKDFDRVKQQEEGRINDLITLVRGVEEKVAELNRLYNR